MMKTNNVMILMMAILVSFFAFGAGKKIPSLTFEGVAVKGATDRFAQRMYSRGFLMESIVNFDINMVGTWEGRPGAKVRIAGNNDNSDIKYVEAVIFVRDDWNDIKKAYDDIVETFAGRWGTPARASYLFDGQDGNDVNDTAKMLRLIAGKADVWSAWNMKDGSVCVSIRYADSKFHISTKYTPTLFY